MKRANGGQRRRDSNKRKQQQFNTLSLTKSSKPIFTQLSLFHSLKDKPLSSSIDTNNTPTMNHGCSISSNNNNNNVIVNGNSNVCCNNECPAANDADLLLDNNDADLLLDNNDAACSYDKDFILSQDFFCTPDYITPECQNLFNNLDGNKEMISCPPSPEKLKSTKGRRYKQDSIFAKSPDSDSQRTVELSTDYFHADEVRMEKTIIATKLGKGPSYVPQSAVALRCRVMPPPCIRNPYLVDASEMDEDPFGSWRTKCSGYFSMSAGLDSMSRYRTDFQEIEHIGNGNFSRVFKVLKRIDGCLYAVKHSIKQLHHDTDRRKAVMEVQALAALGFHENVVAYHTSWFENEQLYIQMELCDYSLSIRNSSHLLTEEDVLEALHQIARALKFIHERGIAHLDVKPDNIYVKKGIYKLGDFGCATLLNKSLPIEEGDARYMPQEILNDMYDHLDKVDIFSLGVSVYELLRGSSLSDTGHKLLKEGKFPLLPSISVQFQNLLKAMVDPDPAQRPSAQEVIENPIFSKILHPGKSRSC